MTKVTGKITLPAPSTMHFYRCTDYADHSIYPGPIVSSPTCRRSFSRKLRNLATAGCKYIQLDEVAVALLCDPGIREQVKNLGGDPDTLVTLYITSINDAVSKCPPDVVIGVHMCRGNFKGHYLGAGSYDRRSQNNSLPKRKSTIFCLNTIRHGPAISPRSVSCQKDGA